MHAKYSQLLALILLLAFSQPAPAQEAWQPKDRDVLVKKYLADLDSTDIHVAAQAARFLGYLRATEAVPAMLRVLRSPRRLSRVEVTEPTPTYNVREWVETSVRAELVNALGSIGDRRAVPALKGYLKRSAADTEVFGGNAAYALYQITGKSYKYRDHDGKMKLFQPSAPSN